MTVSPTARFKLHNPTINVPAPCSFTGTVRKPTPAYSWIECTAAADIRRTCRQVFLDAGVALTGGAGYGAPAGQFVRLELLMIAPSFVSRCNIPWLRMICCCFTKGSLLIEFVGLRRRQSPTGWK